MNLKTRAKILLGLFTLSSLSIPINTHATASPTDTEQTHAHEHDGAGEEVSPARLQLMCYGAYAQQMQAGNIDEVNALREAVRTGRIILQIDAPRMLLDQGILDRYPNLFRAEDICTALRAACTYYRLTGDETLINQIMQFIRDNNIDVDDDEGRILHSAIREGEACENFVRFLLEERHANPSIQYHESGNTALHYAVSYANANMINILLDHGANPSIVNNHGLTPYAIAATAPESLGLRETEQLSESMRIRIQAVRTMENVFRARGITH